MSEPPITVRVMRPDEFVAMRELSAAAFGDDDVIRTLLDALRDSWAWEDELSFVAERDGELVGQVLYTHAILDTAARNVDVLVLSPVGVQPDLQGTGIGSQLIRESLVALAARDEPMVFLEGHPHYYPRFGFLLGDDLGFRSPSTRIPRAAFMVLPLPSFVEGTTGTLVYPDAFWRNDAVGLRDS